MNLLTALAWIIAIGIVYGLWALAVRFIFWIDRKSKPKYTYYKLGTKERFEK